MLIFASGNLFSQNNEIYTVSGQIVDSLTNSPVSFATVRIMEKQSFKIVKAVASDEQGLFSLTINSAGDFVLAAEFIGKNTKKVEFSVSENQKNIDLGKILMADASEQLAEVTVTAAAPLVKTEIDRISYDIQVDPDSKSSNVLEMLQKVPMVTVDGEENIKIKGSSNFKIYLNGKPSTMIANNPSQVLKSMPASSIKKIEVITDPGAKYDAEGVGAILNIVTETSFGGYTGSINASINNLGAYSLGGNFSTKIGKFGISANFTYYKGRDYAQTSYNYQENLNAEVIEDSYRFMQQTSRSSKVGFLFGYGSLEATYELDSLNLVSLSASGYGGSSATRQWRGETLMYADSLNQTPISGYNTLNYYKGGWGGMSVNANYQRSFHKKDRLLTFSYQLDTSPNSSHNNIITRDSVGFENHFNPAPSDRDISMEGKTNEHTFQVDYTEPLGKKHVVEAGVKYILRLNNSNNEYLIRQNSDEIYQIDTTQTSAADMRYRQNIVGAYGSYTFKLEKFSARAGLRMESTSSDVKFLDKPEKNFTPKPYFNVVPSVVLSYKTSDASNLKLSYNQSISRPSIWYLNPFIDNSDATNISKGNPELKPEISNSFSFAYGFFSQKFNLNASLNTSFTNNSIDQMSLLQISDDNKVTIVSTYENIGKHSNSGGNLYFSWTPTKKFRINANTSLNYLYYSAKNQEQTITNEGWTYSIYGGFSYTLPLDLKFGMNFAYQTPWINLQGKGFGWSFSAASLSKDFLNKKLNVSLRLRGVFKGKQVYTNEFRQEDQYYRYYRNERTFRAIGLQVSYTFGEMKTQIKKVQRTITNDDLKSGGNSQGGSGQGGGQ
ncbi:MAG: TonB-dependent receptor [Paludibacter sp.]|nr:TonB-dependent receptor [Paludibacter sp.]